MTDEDDAIEQANLIWRPTNYSSAGYAKIDARKKFNDFPLVFNHFQFIKWISTKTGLIETLTKYYENNEEAKAVGYTVFDTTPTTFIADDDNKYNKLQKILAKHKEYHMNPKQWTKNLWLVKPENLNRGQGIQIFNNIKDIVNFVWNTDSKVRYVVQKYIERPLLYHKRKFDVRVWAIYTSDDKVYYYKRGYLRTSSDFFTLDIENNKSVHLTNNWFQNKLDTYSKYEDGNTLSFEYFQEYLNMYHKKENLNVYDNFVKAIKDIVIDVYLASKDELNKNNRTHWFEMLGFDFMIDEDFRVWLIEWNTNPYIGIVNEFIADLLPRMISEMLDIVLDTVYAPKHKYELPEKNFELIYSKEKNTRRPFDKNLWSSKIQEKLTPYSCRSKAVKIRHIKTVINRNNSQNSCNMI